jgi:hypothetical protein
MNERGVVTHFRVAYGLSHGSGGIMWLTTREGVKNWLKNSPKDAKGRQANNGVLLCASLRLGAFA